MNNRFTLAAMLLPLTMGVVSCTSSKRMNEDSKATTMNGEGITDEDHLILNDAQTDYISRYNDFAFKFFSKTAGFDSKVTSPLSASYLLGMLANGTDGNTHKEILKVMEAGSMTADDINAVYRQLLEKQSRLDSSTVINTANYIAMNRNYHMKNGFASTVKSCYKAAAESLDFSSPEATRHINEWCKEKTSGLIPKIIEETSADDISYIMNAIYFNGTWQSRFDPEMTKKERFQGYTRDIKRADMMHQKDKFMYVAGKDCSAVILPYGNGTFTMTVLLPDEGKSVQDMMQHFNADSFADLLSKAEEYTVDLKLPRFTTETEVQLNGVISQLGAPSVFSAGADFSRFADGSFHISKMLQKAKIEVNETGTKAAAVTTAIVALTALEPDEPKCVNFHANLPFAYVISERSNGVIFFSGQFTGDEL